MIAQGLAPLAVPVGNLELLSGNPRRGDIDAIARSLAAFGQRKPIVATAAGTVIAGNHTLQAARQLGWDEVAVVWVDDDETTAHAYALADNRTAELGGYDDDALAALLAEVHAADAELAAATGWGGNELRALLDRLEPAPTIIGDLDDVPDDAPAITTTGDVWLLGEHRLLCGDATDLSGMALVMAGAPADLVWTDPPYGVDYVGKTADALTITNDALTGTELESMLRSAFTNALANCVPGAAWFVAAPPGPLFLPFVAALTDLGVWHQTLIWLKDALVLGHSDYHYRHEAIIYGWAPGAAHRPPPDRTGDTVWEVPRPKRSETHPTMKPVELIERAIVNHTPRGALVLDPFAGSGSTLIAAHQSGRVARLIELDRAYCDVICKRFQAATGVVPVLESSGEAHDFADGLTPTLPGERQQAGV